MLLVNLFKYYYKEKEQKNVCERLQLFYVNFTGTKSLYNMGNIKIDVALHGDSYRTNELEDNSTLYAFGTLFDTTSNFRFDFMIDSIQVDNDNATCHIEGYYIRQMFNLQAQFDFSQTPKNNKYTPPTLAELWEELHNSLISQDSFWQDFVTFKKLSLDKSITDVVDYTGQYFIANCWNVLKPILIYFNLNLVVSLDNYGHITCQVLEQDKTPLIGLSEHTELLTVTERATKEKIATACVKFKTVELKEEWEVWQPTQEEIKNWDENFSDPNKYKKQQQRIKKLLKSDPIKNEDGSWNLNHKWTIETVWVYYRKQNTPSVTPRPTALPSASYYITDTEEIKLLQSEDKLPNTRLPIRTNFFEKDKLAEAQSEAIFSLAKNLYDYRIECILDKKKFGSNFEVGGYILVRFHGKEKILPIIEVECSYENYQVKERVILGRDIPDINEYSLTLTERSKVKR